MDNLFDTVQGSMGQLVFYQMNGQNYVRTRPVRFTDRKSPGQLAQRQRMKVVNRFLKPFGGLIRTTFASQAQGRTAIQAALSYNLKHAPAGAYPDIRIDPARVVLSKGPLPLPVNASVNHHPEGLLIGWENGAEGAANDTLVVMASWGDGHWSEYRFTDTLRKKGTYLWQTVQQVQEEALPQVWIAFRNDAMTQMSDSLYVAH